MSGRNIRLAGRTNFLPIIIMRKENNYTMLGGKYIDMSMIRAWQAKKKQKKEMNWVNRTYN